MKPGALNFGTSPSDLSIECEVQNKDDLETYPLTVGSATQTTPSETASARPTRTVTTTVTAAETHTANRRTPPGGAETGGGGDAGPDGRVFVLTGLFVTVAAGAGLVLRRRAVSRA